MPTRLPSASSVTQTTSTSPPLSGHEIPHPASEPPIPVSTDELPQASQLPSFLALDGVPSPPIASKEDREAFTSLRPMGSRNEEVKVFTAAAAARGKNMDQEGNLREVPAQQPLSDTVKGIPVAAVSTLSNALPTSAKTLDSIKGKLKSPSTNKKSKTEIPNSLEDAESDAGKANPDRSGLLAGRKDAHSSQPSALMERGPGLDDGRSEFKKENAPSQEDPQAVRQAIKDQQQRLEDLDEAQTIGLLRTQQEAGIEPPQSPQSPSRISRLVGLPLFNSDHKDTEEADHERNERGPRRSASGKTKARRSQSRNRDAPARSSSAHASHPAPSKRNSGTWTSKLRTKIPIKEFPLQGSGKESEFNQECPLWARHPWKYAYFTYFGLSIGLWYLPLWSVKSLFPSKRGRPDWSWKKATMVKLFRHGTQLTFRTRTSLGRDLQKEVPHSKTVRCKFAWVEPVSEEDIKGEIRRAMKIQKISAAKTCGFWYGDTQGKDSGVGKPADPGEKVLYHLHGGAYWIGTAHESDVTAAVNTESLRYLDEIYRKREKEGETKENKVAKQVKEEAAPRSTTRAFSPKADSGSASTSKTRTTQQSSETGVASGSNSKGKMLRSFSLDYRLCVPGRPQAGSYPAALLDALSGYLYLVRQLHFDPDNIVIAGDSAGGNLAIALCRYLRDEGVEKMPGSLLLLSPWCDISRSHAGPTGAPNYDSTVYTNQKSDIISPSLAFRNTAVSAFLGDLPARETYRNPYISPVSLQLPVERGGQAPHWGFHGFPKRIYISSGSAEISNDQHITLAHRMASGTKLGKPIYSGDKLSQSKNARELAERREYPRPKELLDSERNGIGATPADEMQEMSFGTTTIDGEPHQNSNSVPKQEPQEPEDREVIFDEVKDAIHDYLLFKWFEPERSLTWRRIAHWIDDAP